tara:strand:- start:10043 stop:10996 length:954 start_codon:yes stop_codon:yes gene_type:complete
MNIILFVVLILITFFYIQSNTKFQNKAFPVTSYQRTGNILTPKKVQDIIKIDTPLEKRKKLVKKLRNISTSEKVTLQNITQKWSLNKNVMDYDINQKGIHIMHEVIQKMDFLNIEDYYIKNIENIYVMKDKDNNYRVIINSFIYHVNHFTIKLVIDAVYFDDLLFVNLFDIDESGIKNVLQKYDIKYNSQGILNNYNNFDHNVEELLNNFYRKKYKIVHLDTNDINDLSNIQTFTSSFKKKILPLNFPRKSNIFCNKDSTNWNTYGIPLENHGDCIFNNPSIKDVPYKPLDIPGGITNNVDLNKYSWLWNPIQGNIL